MRRNNASLYHTYFQVTTKEDIPCQFLNLIFSSRKTVYKYLNVVSSWFSPMNCSSGRTSWTRRYKHRTRRTTGFFTHSRCSYKGRAAVLLTSQTRNGSGTQQITTLLATNPNIRWTYTIHPIGNTVNISSHI